MDFSIVIPFMNLNSSFRLRNLLYVIQNYEQLMPDIKIFVIEQISDNESIKNELIQFKNVIYLQDDLNKDKFWKTKLLNDAISEIKTEYIIMSDADCIIDKNAVKSIMTEYKFGSILYPFNSVDYFNEAFTRKLIKNEIVPEHDANNRGLALKRFTGMVNCFSKNMYNYINGFDEFFYGWGCEDDAFLIKAERLFSPSYRTQLNSNLIHLFHPKIDTADYKLSDSYLMNKKYLALIKRMSQDDLIYYSKKLKTLDMLYKKYDNKNMLNTELKWKINNVVITLDTTIYDIKEDDISIEKILKCLYDNDGKEFMMNIVNQIKNTVLNLTEEQKNEIKRCEQFS